MSYITLAVDEGVTITVKDQDGFSVGATYLDYGPGNPAGDGNINASNPLNIFEYAKPETGSYTIELSSETQGIFN